MSAYNRITLQGIVNTKPELKKEGKNKKASFILACRVTGRDNQGNRDYDDYFNIVTEGKLAEIIGTYLDIGKRVIIDGKIHIRTYIENDQRKWITEIIVENIKFLFSPVYKESVLNQN